MTDGMCSGATVYKECCVREDGIEAEVEFSEHPLGLRIDVWDGIDAAGVVLSEAGGLALCEALKVWSNGG